MITAGSSDRNSIDKGGGEFDSGAITVNDDTNWIAVALIQANGRHVLLRGDVGAGGALAHLKVSQAPTVGGVHNDLAVDADFATATVAVPYVLGSTIHQTAGGGSFQIRLSSGAGEYTVWAKKAAGDTTLRLRGRLF